MVFSSPSKETVSFRHATPDHAEGIRQLLRATPFGHRISLTLEPDPGQSFGDPSRHHTIVATRASDPHDIIGLAERTSHHAWVNNQPARLGYLGQLRRKPGENITLFRLREGYNMLEEQRRDDELTYDYTSILADNTPARRLLERGLPGLPRYETAGTMTTLTISTARARRVCRPLNARPLGPESLQGVLDCLHRHHRQRHFAPQLDASTFQLPGIEWFHTTRGKRTTGCLALWNQASFKTIAVRGYPFWLRCLRHPVNLLRRLQGAPRLPRPGDHLPLGFLAFLAADQNEPEPICALIAAAAQAASQQDLTHLCLGLPARHPILPALRTTLRPESTDSIIYLVHPFGKETPSPLDPALPVHPEIALL